MALFIHLIYFIYIKIGCFFKLITRFGYLVVYSTFGTQTLNYIIYGYKSILSYYSMCMCAFLLIQSVIFTFTCMYIYIYIYQSTLSLCLFLVFTVSCRFHTTEMERIASSPLNTKDRQFDNFVVAGVTVICNYDIFNDVDKVIEFTIFCFQCVVVAGCIKTCQGDRLIRCSYVKDITRATFPFQDVVSSLRYLLRWIKL